MVAHARENCLVVIPARLASTRLPRKLLLSETGRPLIEHSYQAALSARRPSEVCVAADHEEIARAVRRFGGRVVMTDPEARSGADRVAEVARSRSDVQIFVNFQGDEPELPGAHVDMAVAALEADPRCGMATLATPIRDIERLNDPACVKVVMDGEGRALYFSRSVIPHARQWSDDLLAHEPALFHQHIGLYVYRRDFLLRLADLPSSTLEQTEQLEQLRVLQAGCAIRVAVAPHAAKGIDTPDDYRQFVLRCRRLDAQSKGA